MKDPEALTAEIRAQIKRFKQQYMNSDTVSLVNVKSSLGLYTGGPSHSVDRYLLSLLTPSWVSYYYIGCL